METPLEKAQRIMATYNCLNLELNDKENYKTKEIIQIATLMVIKGLTKESGYEEFHKVVEEYYFQPIIEDYKQEKGKEG